MNARRRRWTTCSRAVLVAAIVFVAGCSGFRTAPEAAWQSVSLGLCEDYPEESRSLERARTDLAFARDVGAQALRISFGWDAMEPERGVYDWSFWDDFVRMATDEYGLRLIPYVCYTPKWAASDPGENFWRSPPRDPLDFGRFMSAIVARYRHAIDSWELWNEPDNPAYWLGNVEQFAALVRAGSQAVRTADPSARVVLGGIATELKFLDDLFRAQRIAPAVDVVNLHSYFETWHPDSIERLPDYIEDAAEIVRTYGEREPLWMAETGYSSVGGRAKISDVYQARWRGEHTDEAQATALARIVLLALGTRELSLVAWYRINDLEPAQEVIGDDNNRHLGIRRPPDRVKPAARTFAELGNLFSQPYRVVEAPINIVEHQGTEPEVRVFMLQDQRYVMAAWMGKGDMPKRRLADTPDDDRRRAVVKVELPVTAEHMKIMDAAGRRLASERVLASPARQGQHLQFELRGGELILVVAHAISRSRPGITSRTPPHGVAPQTW